MEKTDGGASVPPKYMISNSVIKKANKFVEMWRDRQQNKYIDKGHETYCKTNNIADLTKPVIYMNVTIMFPIMKLTYDTYTYGNTLFDLRLLNFPRQKFQLIQIQGINLSFTNYTLKNLLYKGSNDSVTYFENLIDYEWLKDMNNYITNLSTKDIYTLIGYTYYGDIIVNNHMQGKLNITMFMGDLVNKDWIKNYYPLYFQAIDKLYDNSIININSLLRYDEKISIPHYSLVQDHPENIALFSGKKMWVSEIITQIKAMKTLNRPLNNQFLYLLFNNIKNYMSFSNFWIDVINKYITDLDNIIDKSPKIKKKMIVYRGVKDDYYLKGKSDTIYKTNNFVSTSVNLASSLQFAGPKCCLKRIVLLPGTKAILMAGISKFENEMEILLGSKSQFYITKGKSFISKDTTNICSNKNDKITVTDTVVIK